MVTIGLWSESKRTKELVKKVDKFNNTEASFAECQAE
jgi:hypothetical protein